MAVQKAMVLGMARSGIAAAKLLLLRGAEVWVCDTKKREDFNGALDELEKGGAHLLLNEKHPEEHLAGLDLLVVSPGVPVEHPAIEKAKALGVEVVGEIEYAYRESTGLLLAVTGTNGKTTTVTLLGEIFKNAGRTTHAAATSARPIPARCRKCARRRDGLRDLVVHDGDLQPVPSRGFGGAEHLRGSHEPPSHHGALHRPQGAHL